MERNYSKEHIREVNLKKITIINRTMATMFRRDSAIGVAQDGREEKFEALHDLRNTLIQEYEDACDGYMIVKTFRDTLEATSLGRARYFAYQDWYDVTLV